MPRRGGHSARANERCAGSGTDTRQKGSSLAAGPDKNAFHRRWPMTWRACRPTDVKRSCRRRPPRRAAATDAMPISDPAAHGRAFSVLPAVAGPGPGHFPTGSVVPAPRKTWVFVPFLSGKTEKIGSRPLDRRSKLSTTCTTNRARCCPGSHSSTDGGTIAGHLISGFARDEHDPPLDGPRLLPCDQQLVQLLFASDEGRRT